MRNFEFTVGGERRQSRGKCEGKLEARGGIEPPIKVLQTFALPLGDRARRLRRRARAATLCIVPSSGRARKVAIPIRCIGKITLYDDYEEGFGSGFAAASAERADLAADAAGERDG